MRKRPMRRFAPLAKLRAPRRPVLMAGIWPFMSDLSTVASQMAEARLTMLSVDLQCG